MFCFNSHFYSEDFKFWIDVLVASSAVFTAFIAFISIGIAFFSLREARKYRENSYKPDLYLAFPITLKSRVRNFHAGVREIQCLINDSNLKESESWGIWHSIENIGLGAARDIRIKWNFNVSKACSIIEKTAPNHLKIHYDDGLLSVKNSEREELIRTSFLFDLEESTTYDFILPRKDERFKMSPFIPQPILELYTIMFLIRHDIFYRNEMPDMYFEDFPEFPKLSAKLTYTDIGGKCYCKIFYCIISMHLTEHLPQVLMLQSLEHFDISLSIEVNVKR